MRKSIIISQIIFCMVFIQILWVRVEAEVSSNQDKQLSQIYEDAKNEFFIEINSLFKNHFRKFELIPEDTSKIVDARNQIPYLFERLMIIAYQKHEPKFSQWIKQGDEESLKKFGEKFTALAKHYAARFVGSLFYKSPIYDFEISLPHSRGKSQLELVLQALGYSARTDLPDIPKEQWFTNEIEPDFTSQWAIDAVNVRKCYETTKGNGIIVAILDSGIDLYNSLFKDKLEPGFNLLQRTTPPWSDEQTSVIDWTAHGTVSASTLLMIAPDCRIMPVKIIDQTMFDPVMDYWVYELQAAGIYYAVNHGAHVIQIGGALKSSNPVIADAVRYAYYHNVIICTSAGNIPRAHLGFRPEHTMYKSFDNEVLLIGGVGMEDNRMRLSHFSVPNAFMDVAAPAEHVFLVLPVYMNTENMYGDGTSLSSPIVAGVVALMRSAAPPPEELRKQPGAYCRQVSKCLRQTARLDVLGLVEPNDVVGQGLIDAPAAMQMIQAELGTN